MGYKNRLAMLLGVVGLASGLVASAVHAQTPLPVGPQALANTTTAGNQDEAAVAVDPNGNFLVVWRDELLGGSGSAILGRRFSARTGLPLSAEIPIHVSPDGDLRNPAVAMAADGHFVVVWEGPDTVGTPAPSTGIFGSLREANGTAIVAEFPVNSNTAGNQRRPAAAMQPTGAFLVAWQDNLPPGLAPDENIGGRIFPANFPSSPPSNPFLVNVGLDGDQEQPAVAALPGSGGWLVGWQGPRQISPVIPMILVRKLDANGDGPPEFDVNTSGTAGQRAHVALAANVQGEAVAAWEAPDGSFRGIFARRFSNGVPSGGEEQVNLTTTQDEREPSVAIDERGAFVTVWVVATPGFSAWDEAPQGSPIIILGRKRGGGGGLAEALPPPLDAEFQINTSGADFLDPWVATEPRGNFVVAWQGTGTPDPDGNGVFYRGFRDVIFADGFESQDTSRWSATIP